MNIMAATVAEEQAERGRRRQTETDRDRLRAVVRASVKIEIRALDAERVACGRKAESR